MTWTPKRSPSPTWARISSCVSPTMMPMSVIPASRIALDAELEDRLVAHGDELLGARVGDGTQAGASAPRTGSGPSRISPLCGRRTQRAGHLALSRTPPRTAAPRRTPAAPTAAPTARGPATARSLLSSKSSGCGAGTVSGSSDSSTGASEGFGLGQRVGVEVRPEDDGHLVALVVHRQACVGQHLGQDLRLRPQRGGGTRSGW